MREEEVGGFKVAVKDPVVMEMMYCPQQLYHQRFDLTWEAGGGWFKLRQLLSAPKKCYGNRNDLLVLSP